MFLLKVPTINSIDDILELYELQLNVSDDKIKFDFSKSNFIKSNFSAVIGALMFYNKNILNKQVTFIEPQDKIYEILCKNKFFPKINKNHNSKIDTFHTALEYSRIKLNDFNSLKLFIQKFKSFMSENHSNRISKRTLNRLTQNITEILLNAFIHSDSKIGVFSAGQFFPQRDELFFTIVDMGVTIKANVNNFLNKNYNGFEAINWATESQNSTKNEGGLGLSKLKEHIESYGGELDIISNDGYVKIYKDQKIEKILDTPFKGTIINIIFNTKG